MLIYTFGPADSVRQRTDGVWRGVNNGEDSGPSLEVTARPAGREASTQSNINRGNTMKKLQRVAGSVVVLTMLLCLGACAGMSERGQDTAIGAGVGGVAGAVLTGGSPVGTVGGAVVGGVVGNQIKK
jgi:osmotically inducible lipoprotein OsmB